MASSPDPAVSEPALTVEAAEREDARDIAYASQWRLVFIRLRRHRLAIVSGIVLAALYLMAAFAPFLSPHDPTEKSLEYREAPPQRLHVFSDKGLHLRSFVYPFTATTTRTARSPTRCASSCAATATSCCSCWSRTHLFGTGVPEVPIHLLGTDHLGRDMLARVMYGAQISLSVGLVGVAISFILGILIGGLAGYFGGFVDEAVQRVVEVLLSIPQLPLWMGLSAALPLSWPVVRMYFAITVTLSLVGWTRLAREVRGKFLSLRQEDYVVAAQVAGMRDVPIIFRHMVPSFLSHIVASLTLSIPLMIIGETSLSFLGLGMQAPAISWSVLLQSAQKVQTLELAPWLMIPALYVIVTVLAFNFLGDGLRDAADPYGQT